MRANVICPGFVRTPLVDKQIPEQAKKLGISEDDVIKKVMLKEPSTASSRPSPTSPTSRSSSPPSRRNALTGQSLVVSHGWFMQ